MYSETRAPGSRKRHCLRCFVSMWYRFRSVYSHLVFLTRLVKQRLVESRCIRTKWYSDVYSAMPTLEFHFLGYHSLTRRGWRIVCNRVLHDKQIWEICEIWQKYNTIFKNYHNLNFYGKGYLILFSYQSSFSKKLKSAGTSKVCHILLAIAKQFLSINVANNFCPLS